VTQHSAGRADAAGSTQAPAPRVVIAYDAAAADGPPDASDTLAEAAAIARALAVGGYRTHEVPVGLDLAHFERVLEELAPVAVFNLVESLVGRGRLIHLVPALLEALGMPFTGCSSAALAHTSNKPEAKAALAAAGVRVPAAFTDPAGDGEWIVKSVFEHASCGLDDGAVVRGAAAVRRALAERTAAHGGAWFAEAFLPGRELNVALLGVPEAALRDAPEAATRDPQETAQRDHRAAPAAAAPFVLPVAEIAYRGFPADKPEIVSYAAKWHSDSFEYRSTERTFAVESELAVRAAALARRCWQLFGLSGYARVDLRADASGELHVLEVNANPCLAPDAGFAAALAHAEIDYARAVGALVAAAVERGASTEGRLAP
jgi:D-alanine-D-alanine ligase